MFLMYDIFTSISLFGLLLVYILGAILLYKYMPKEYHIIYRYGFWAFLLLFGGQLFHITPWMINMFGYNVNEFIITLSFVLSNLLRLIAMVILLVGFHKSIVKS